MTAACTKAKGKGAWSFQGAEGNCIWLRSETVSRDSGERWDEPWRSWGQSSEPRELCILRVMWGQWRVLPCWMTWSSVIFRKVTVAPVVIQGIYFLRDNIAIVIKITVVESFFWVNEWISKLINKFWFQGSLALLEILNLKNFFYEIKIITLHNIPNSCSKIV